MRSRRLFDGAQIELGLIPVEAATGGPPAQSLTPLFFADADAVFVPTVAPGAVTITPPFLADSDAVFVPFISFSALPPDARIARVSAMLRAARVEAAPRHAAPGAPPRIILIT